MSATATAGEIRERPILFSGPMVRAILEGRKTQTRRVMKTQPNPEWTEVAVEERYAGHTMATYRAFPDGGTARWAICECPYGSAGDRLWVREAAYIAPPNFSDADAVDAKHWDYKGVPRIVGYAASMDGESVRCALDYGVKKTPSTHVPRWASRITLQITGIRVERLTEISDVDIRAEGIDVVNDGTGNVRAAWANGWNAINEKRGYSWLHNPWVWAITFTRYKGESCNTK